MVNLDFFNCALSQEDLQYVILLGEGTFHQIHGGVASDAAPSNHPWEEFHQEYENIRGRPYQRVLKKHYYMGRLQTVSFQPMESSVKFGAKFWQKNLGTP